MLLPFDVFSEIFKYIPYSEQGYLRLTSKQIYLLPLTFEQACSIPSIAECIAFISKLSDENQAKLRRLQVYDPIAKISRTIDPTNLKNYQNAIFVLDNFYTDNFLIYRLLCKSRNFIQRVFPDTNTDLNIIPEMIHTFHRTHSNPYRKSSELTALLWLFKDEIHDQIETDATQVFGEDQLGCIFNDDALNCNPPRLTEVISYIIDLISKLNVNDLKTLDDLEIPIYGKVEINDESINNFVPQFRNINLS